jgi:hypothetical protein
MHNVKLQKHCVFTLFYRCRGEAGAEYHGGVSDGGERVHQVQVRGDGRLLHLPARPAQGQPRPHCLPGPPGEAHKVTLHLFE